MQVFYKGYKRLERKVNDLSAVAVTNAAVDKKLQENLPKQNEYIERIKSLEKKVKELEQDKKWNSRKEKSLTGVIQHSYQMIKDLEKKMEAMEIKQAKSMVTISGLVVDTTDKKEMIKEVEAFLEVEPQASVPIDDVYTLGEKFPPQLVVQL